MPSWKAFKIVSLTLFDFLPNDEDFFATFFNAKSELFHNSSSLLLCFASSCLLSVLKRLICHRRMLLSTTTTSENFLLSPEKTKKNVYTKNFSHFRRHFLKLTKCVEGENLKTKQTKVIWSLRWYKRLSRTISYQKLLNFVHGFFLQGNGFTTNDSQFCIAYSMRKRVVVTVTVVINSLKEESLSTTSTLSVEVDRFQRH